jgi:hypothetical protein
MIAGIIKRNEGVYFKSLEDVYTTAGIRTKNERIYSM